MEQCEEARAAVDLISAAPNIPLRTYGALASKLAAAIEGVMEVLGPGSNIRWKNGWPRPQNGCDWRIDVSGGLCAKTSWVLRLGQRIKGCLLIQDLTAGLSLWIDSLMSGNSSISRLYNGDMRHDFYLVSPGAAQQFKKLTLGEPASFLRFIGKSDFSTMEEIGSWIPAVRSRRMPCAAIDGYGGNGDGGWLVSHNESCRSRPIFGLYNSALFK